MLWGSCYPKVLFWFAFIAVYKYDVVVNLFCCVPILFEELAFVTLIILTYRVSVSKSCTPSLHHSPGLELLLPFLVHYSSMYYPNDLELGRALPQAETVIVVNG